MTTVHTVCPDCHADVFTPLSAIRTHPFSKIQCSSCGAWYKQHFSERKGRSDKQIRSKEQETRAASRYGAKRQPGSGSSKRAKGDFVDRNRIRGECKHTTRASFSLKLTELLKLEKEATALETPLFEVEFQGVHPPKAYVVLPADKYQMLLDEIEASKS